MKFFLQKTIVYFFCVITLLYLIQLLIDKGLKKRNDEPYFIWNYIKKGDINADVVILGSSRIKKHIVVPEIERITHYNAINLGLDGANVFLQQSIWNTYKRYNKYPKFMIVELDLIRLEHDKVIHDKDHFLPYLTDAEVYPFISKINGFSYADVVIPFYKYHDYYKTVKLGMQGWYNNTLDSVTIKNKGFSPLLKTMKDTLVKKKDYIMQLTDVELSIKILQSLLDDLSLHGTKVIFVNTPKYKGGELNISNKDAIEKILGNFLSSNNLHFLDYTNMQNVSADYRFFYDAEHLNENGAYIFTNHFSEKFLSLKL